MRVEHQEYTDQFRKQVRELCLSTLLNSEVISLNNTLYSCCSFFKLEYLVVAILRSCTG